MLLSGEQLELTSGNQAVVVATVGATLRSYAVRGRPVIDGFAADEVCPGGRGQVLMPWPNRVADGKYELAGALHQLPIDEPELGHAIHGLVRWAEWRVEHQTAESVRLRHRLMPRPGYPFALDLSVEYRLSSEGLVVVFGAMNVGSASCPFGAGAHPYFTFGRSIDRVNLRVNAASRLQLDARSIPRGRRPVEGSDADFRRERAIGDARLDTAFTELDRDREGIARVFLRDGISQLTIWFDRAFPFVQVYTGDTLPDELRRRQGIAVEPMTCAPDAFNNKDGLRIISPGETFQGRWGVTVS
ncbi:MAG: aldose 1-epimerase family protein [Deltaproteobacteria bacterium]|nr:aldose 1-epimerase family protein [Deltaproteobacteria bacterium]